MMASNTRIQFMDAITETIPTAENKLPNTACIVLNTASVLISDSSSAFL